MRRLLTFLVTVAAFIAAAADLPFTWKQDGAKLTLTVAPDAYVYAESLRIDGDVTASPTTERHYDDLLEKEIDIYGPGSHIWTADKVKSISYQGCGSGICYPPKTERFAADVQSVAAETPTTTGELPAFEVVRTKFGLADAEDMTAFLRGESDIAPYGGIWAMLLLALLGGLALNLTPCVLPLIPVNLAIIGAGSGKKRSAGLVAGAVYGLGMAAAYGALGLLAAFTGTRFGTLNSFPWFNFSVAAVFLLLALAMSGVFSLDFSRFRGGFKMWNRFRLAGVFIFGALAALLAGACVAPIVVTVLLVAAGGGAAVLLPFVLGLGMALPWPLAGAGLTVLPKPGAWMRYVKWVFALIILLLAAWYGYTGYTQLPREGSAGTGYSIHGENQRLEAALIESGKTGLPVFLDVWSTSCKNCLHMDETTFKAPEVEEALKKYIVIKFQIENYSDPLAKALLEKLGAPGLPVVAVLKP
ncbi:MAG: cytochrome c biogenesis protein CcdA [Victivallaceae bacterium]|nr:cytochrome c biogenesis protein CcdA [Victivallaceae bacterium]